MLLPQPLGKETEVLEGVVSLDSLDSLEGLEGLDGLETPTPLTTWTLLLLGGVTMPSLTLSLLGTVTMALLTLSLGLAGL